MVIARPALMFSQVGLTYGRPRVRALVDVTLGVGVGRTVLLGPNGAGKSTLIGCGAGVLTPDRGVITLDGSKSSGWTGRRARRHLRRWVGWMPQDTQVIHGLRVREQVATAGWLKGLGRSQAWAAAVPALAQAGLSEHAERPTTSLSGGERARLGLAQALVHDSAVLLLDEPLAALDPDHRERFLGLLPELGERRAVLVSTHDVNDLATLFDRVVVLADGVIRFDGTTSAFLARAGAGGRPVDAYRASVGGVAGPVSR